MSYTVTWKNYDGTVLEIDEDVKQGAMPHYDGVTPEKGGNAQYSYSWTGWTPEIQTVVSDITYFAVFDEVVNKYTVTWKNYDGTVLEIDGNVPYGDVPSFDGITPTRISDDEFEYAFSEWSPSIEQVTADIIYVAQFSSNKVGYKIIFDFNGADNVSGLSSSVYIKNISPEYFYFNLTKSNFNFRGWEYNGDLIIDENKNVLSSITLVDNMVFKARFVNTAKLTIVSNMDSAGEFGGGKEFDFYTYCDIFAHPYQGYNFVGWYQINNETLNYDVLIATEEDYKFLMWTEDVTIQAKFEIAAFSLRIYSNNPDIGLVYDTSNPNKQAVSESVLLHYYLSTTTITAITSTDTYRFLGWYDDDNLLISPNAVYTFEMVNYSYVLEAKWDRFSITYDLDGGVQNPENPNHFSSADRIVLHNPTREGYEFVGWTLEGNLITEVDGSLLRHITLVANWNILKYTITWKNYDGTILEEDNNVPFGTTPSYDSSTPIKVGDAQYSYTWTGWSPSVTKVNGNATYTAIYSQSINKYTITWKNYDDSILLQQLLEYGSTPSYSLTTPTKPNDTYCSYTFLKWSPDISTVVSDIEYVAEYRIAGPTKYTYDSTTESYILSSCTSTTKVLIPSFYDDGINGKHPVTKIASKAFYNLSSITQVDFEKPSNIETIGSYAFSGDIKWEIQGYKNGKNSYKWSYTVPSFQSIEIPNSVTTIEDHAFYSVTSLKTIAFEEGNKPLTIGSYAFSGYMGNNFTSWYTTVQTFKNLAVSISSIEFPNRLVRIEDHAFFNCSKLSVLTINDESQLNYIGDFAFSGTRDSGYYSGSYNYSDYYNPIIELINIPDSIVEIGKSAFSGCRSLSSVEIANDLILGESAFSSCTSMRKADLNVKNIPNRCFQDCTNLKELNLGNDVETLGSYSFYNCTSLSDIDFGENVQNLGSYAFYYCRSLDKITVPNSVSSLGEYCFWECRALKTVILGNGITYIPKCCFAQCQLDYLVVPNSIVEIGEYVFSQWNTYGNDGDFKIFYEGTAEQWDLIINGSESNFTDNGATIQVYYYSEEQPSLVGNYWHYINGVPTLW
jgi:uncharacterized repeat protein (TIGR02543 family)